MNINCQHCRIEDNCRWCEIYEIAMCSRCEEYSPRYYHTARRNDDKHHVLDISANPCPLYGFWKEHKAVNVKV